MFKFVVINSSLDCYALKIYSKVSWLRIIRQYRYDFCSFLATYHLRCSSPSDLYSLLSASSIFELLLAFGSLTKE